MQAPTKIPLRPSAQTSVAGTTTGNGVRLRDSASSMSAVFDLSVIGLLTQAADTLDVYIDASHDDGLTWFNVGRFKQITGVDSVYATGTLTSTGAITSGVHAESVLTSDTSAPNEVSTCVIGSTTYRFTDAIIRAARQILSVGAKPAELETVTIGTKTYRFTDAIFRAARGTLTNDTTDVADGNTVTIGPTIYQFKSIMGQAFDVQIDVANPDVTLANLVKAINGTGTPGVEYFAGTTAHPDVTAGAVTSHAIVITAKVGGVAGNSIATTTTATHDSWATGTLIGGHNDTANDVLIGANAESAIDNLVLAITHGATEGTNYGTGTTASIQVTAVKSTASTMTATALVAGATGNSIGTTETLSNGSWGAVTLAMGHNDTANDVLIGGSAAVALDNLKAAINGSGLAGTNYGTGTVAHTGVVATTNTNTTQKVVARIPGTAANSLATTQAGTSHCSWEDTTLGGGTGLSVTGIAGETVTAGTKTYMFVTALSETSGATSIANQVLYGGNVTNAFANLVEAINSGPNSGTDYSTATTANADAAGTASDATTVSIQALVIGTPGNSVATTETMANGNFAHATLTGGTYGPGIVARQSLTWSPALVETSQPVNIESDISNTAGGIRQVGFGDMIRYRGVVAGVEPDFTYSVYCVAKL